MPPCLRQATRFRKTAVTVLLLTLSCCINNAGASVTLFNAANSTVELPTDGAYGTAMSNATSSDNVTLYTCDFPRYVGSYDEVLALFDVLFQATPSTCVLDVEKLNAEAQARIDVGRLARGFGLLVNWNAARLHGCRRYGELMTQITDYSMSNSNVPFQLRAVLFTAPQTSRTDIGFPYVTPYGDLHDQVPGPVYFGLIAADDGAELGRRLDGWEDVPVLVRLTGEPERWNLLVSTSSIFFWTQSIWLLMIAIAALYAIYQVFLIFRDANRCRWKARSAIHMAGLGYAIVIVLSVTLVPLNLLDAQIGLAFYYASVYFEFSAYDGLLNTWNSVASGILKHSESRVRRFKGLCFSCHALFILMTICLMAGSEVQDFTLLRVGFNLIFILLPTVFAVQAVMFGYLAYTLIQGDRNQLSESTRITTRRIVILSTVSMVGDGLLAVSAIMDGLWISLTVPGYIAQTAVRQCAYFVLFGIVILGQNVRGEGGEDNEKEVGSGGWKRLWSVSKFERPSRQESKTEMFPEAKRSAQKSKWSVLIEGDDTTYLEGSGAKKNEFGPGQISIFPLRRSTEMESGYQRLSDASNSTMESGRRELERMSIGDGAGSGRASIRMSSRSTPETREKDTSDGSDDLPMLPDDINEGVSFSRLAKSLPRPPKATRRRTRIRPPIPSPFLNQDHGAEEDAFVGAFDDSHNPQKLFRRQSTMAIQIPSLKCLNHPVDTSGFPKDGDMAFRKSLLALDTRDLPFSSLPQDSTAKINAFNENISRRGPFASSNDNVRYPPRHPFSTYRGSIVLESIHGIAIRYKGFT